MGPLAPANPFGPNVHIFDDSMSQADIEGTVTLETDQFGPGRHAYLFMPGTSYSLNIQIGYYTTVHGLGRNSPDDVTITGSVERRADQTGGVALNNFWCGVENVAVKVQTIRGDPTLNMWAVSQATYLRRFHVMNGGGGFIADSKVEGTVNSGSQQQFLTRNTEINLWNGGVWNMVFVGDVVGAFVAQGSWPTTHQTIVDDTPAVREKPYLVFDDSTGDFAVQVPKLQNPRGHGVSWNTPDPNPPLPISDFYIANNVADNTDTINDAMRNHRGLILTPGVYQLTGPLEITRADTVVLGLGMATLVPKQGTAALNIADVDGVSICGIIVDAGIPILPHNESLLLLVVGTEGDSGNHFINPTALSVL